MSPREGRGLRQAFPDLIPLERSDILDDLKQFVDIHRLTDFTIHDRVVPTIALNRQEDSFLVVAALTRGQVAAQFSTIQLWNGTPDKLLRPKAIFVVNQVGASVVLSFDATINPGAPQTATPLDRRRVGGPPALGSTVIGNLLSSNQGAQLGLGIFMQITKGIGVGDWIRPEAFETMALPPGTGLDFQSGGVNETIVASVIWKVETLNRTRSGGL